MAKFCMKCGAPLGTGKFCEKCETPVTQLVPAQPAQAPAPRFSPASAAPPAPRPQQPIPPPARPAYAQPSAYPQGYAPARSYSAKTSGLIFGGVCLGLLFLSFIAYTLLDNMVDDAIAADEAGQGVYTTSQPETTVGELPAAVAAKVNTSAVVSDYAGSYTGTAVLTMDNAELLLSVGMVPPGDAAALKAMLGKPFPATAEVDEDYDRVEISAPLPAPFDSDLGETFYLDDDMVNVNGVWTNTEDQSGEQDGVTMAMRGVQKIALLSDGGIYILISAEMNIGGEMGVMELRFELTR